MLITESLVNTEYQIALSECQDKIPLKSWKVQPTGLNMSCRKGAYGEVTPEGVVKINPAFLGTEAINKLRWTLRHELAHLCVGLKMNHNKFFRHCETYFCQGINVPEKELENIISTIDYKWLVIAHLVDGRAISIGGVHRKTKKYADYHNSKQRHSYKGTDVARYEFIEQKG